jgi:hypothetical protein
MLKFGWNEVLVLHIMYICWEALVSEKLCEKVFRKNKGFPSVIVARIHDQFVNLKSEDLLGNTTKIWSKSDTREHWNTG